MVHMRSGTLLRLGGDFVAWLENAVELKLYRASSWRFATYSATRS
jgi:hypothetical protein